jgi:hypothetical protein
MTPRECTEVFKPFLDEKEIRKLYALSKRVVVEDGGKRSYQMLDRHEFIEMVYRVAIEAGREDRYAEDEQDIPELISVMHKTQPLNKFKHVL